MEVAAMNEPGVPGPPKFVPTIHPALRLANTADCGAISVSLKREEVDVICFRELK